MKTYSFLSRIGFSRKYSAKFLFIAFLGIHIPLLGIVAYLLFKEKEILEPWIIFSLVLLLTLIASGATLILLNQLLLPLRKTRQALDAYAAKGTLPNLPVNYEDEAGVLMRHTQETLSHLDNLINVNRDLISLFSHDVRTPITQIMGFCEIIKAQTGEEETAELTDHIQLSCERQLELMSSILTLLRQENAELANDMILFPLNELFKDVEKGLHKQLYDKNISLIHSGNANFEVYAIPGLLKSVFSNLISNAIKFSYRDQTIEVKIKRSEENLVISFEDQGMGFKPDIGDSLFNRFTKSGQSGTEGEESIGLGLYLSRKIAELHNGTLKASSNGKDKGATFVLTLPISEQGNTKQPAFHESSTPIMNS